MPWIRPEVTAGDLAHRDLRRWFAYIAANGAWNGSLRGYVRHEIEQAARDDAPADAVYGRDWDSLSESQRRSALLDETDGYAYLVRDEDRIVRVWHRITGFDNKVVRDTLDTLAARIREHGNPWATTEAEDAAVAA